MYRKFKHEDGEECGLVPRGLGSPTRRELLLGMATVSAAAALGGVPAHLLAAPVPAPSAPAPPEPNPSVPEAGPKPAVAPQSVTTPVPVESLEARVNRYVRQLRRRGLITPDERTSWSVYDFTTGKKLVSINEDLPLQAASMIKPFVVQAFFYRLDEPGSRLRYDKKVRRIMERMIRNSSNHATNRLIRLISKDSQGRGPLDVQQVLQHHAPGIFRQTRIVETIPRGGKTYKNKASAHDYSRFLYALWNDGLPHATELKELMALPNRDRIYSGVREIPAQTMVYDKTGTTSRLCGNMGILDALGKDGKRYPYTMIAIIEKSQRTHSLSRWAARRGGVIRAVSQMVYLDRKAQYNLV